MKIAIVEDERLFRDVLRKACTADLGHEVVGEAGTGCEALVVVPKVLPDLLILDVQLPDMDGFEVLRSLRRKRGPFWLSGIRARERAPFSTPLGAIWA